MEKILKVGTRVRIVPNTGMVNRTGVVYGHAVTVTHSGYGNYLVYLVYLDHGFWSEDKETFVSIMVVAWDIVEERK